MFERHAHECLDLVTHSNDPAIRACDHMVDAGGKSHVYTAADLARDQTAAVIVMRFIVYAIVFATSFTVVALLIVLAIPIGTAIDCPICTNKTAIALIALGSASAGAVLGLGTAGLYRTRADSI